MQTADVDDILRILLSVTIAYFDIVSCRAVPTLGIAVYNLLFTEDINAEILETVARSALLVEKEGKVSTNNITVTIAGYTGIFDTEDDMLRDVDG